MKLISCYIENYGAISRREFNFDGDITCICEQNGYGKSTLASFIKAMFYGLEPYKKNTREFTERQHYCPFGGGKFGGNVTFSADGKVYKIERFFGEKSDLNDEFSIYCGGAPVKDITDAGMYFFGLDRQSFGRTVFIDGGDTEISSTAGINAKLNCFLEGATENFDLENALALIEKTAKQYKKSRTENDLISKEKLKIEALNREITNAESIKLALDEKYRKFELLKGEIAAAEQGLARAQTLNVELNDWEHYDSLINEAQTAGAQIKAIGDGYARGIPEVGETEEVKARLVKDGELRAKLAQSGFDGDSAAKLGALSAAFKDGLPSEEQLLEAESKIAELTELQTQIRLTEGRQIPDKDKKVKHIFGTYLPTDNEVEGVNQKLAQYKSARSAAESIPEYVAGETAKPKGSAKPYIVAAAILAVLAVAGIGVVFVQLVAGIIMLALGVVGVFADGFLYLSKKSAGTAAISVENHERRQREREAAALSDAVKAFLMPFGYSSENGVEYDFATFCDDFKYYKNITETEKNEQNSLAEMRGRAVAAEQFLSGFFVRYGVRESGYLNALSTLRGNVEAYTLLKQAQTRAEQSVQTLESRIRENFAPVSAFCIKYGIDVKSAAESVKRIEEDRRAVGELERRARDAENKARELKKVKKLTARPEGESIDVRELNALLSKKRGEQSLLYREIESDEGEAEKLGYFKNELQQAKERLKEYAKKHEILTATAEFLRAAEQSLKDRYVKPIKDKFLYYSGLLEKTLGEKVTMGKDFGITFERNGRERSDRHLSAGQRSLAALCFRLALVYNMYSKEKPFIIMDDPFSSLDGAHMQKVRDVLGELSHGMQIIYMCCHESRRI